MLGGINGTNWSGRVTKKGTSNGSKRLHPGLQHTYHEWKLLLQSLNPEVTFSAFTSGGTSAESIGVSGMSGKQC